MEYRFLDNLLRRFFGDAVELSYRFDPALPPEEAPQLWLEGELVAVGGLPAQLLLERLRHLGYGSRSSSP